MSVFNNRRKKGVTQIPLVMMSEWDYLILDWQLGRNTFMNKYNNFWKAVANGDYEGMRKESRTTGTDKKGQQYIL